MNKQECVEKLTRIFKNEYIIEELNISFPISQLKIQ